ncbi:MAG: DUF3422 family protein [Pontibacterium sp.]
MTPSNTGFKLDIHDQRDALYAELHSRPFQTIPSPSKIGYLAVMITPDQKAAEFQNFQRLYEYFGVVPPEEDSMCTVVEFDGFKVRREKHFEFTTYMVIDETNACVKPFVDNALSLLPEEWIASLPGKVIASFHIEVGDVRACPEPSLQDVKGYFEGMRLIGSQPQNGDAQVWTSFQIHSDGCARFLIYNRNMSDSQLGRLILRLIEIETYRLMALLSLPLARRYNAELGTMDQSLAEVTARLSESKEELDEPKLLAQLIDMASWVEAARAKTTFRFSATQAYYDLVTSRLGALKEDEVSGHLTINEFMTRRLSPAVSTCQATSSQLESLSRRIDRVSDMMRTRVELSIQAQNQDLLTSMDKRSEIQLMMQHTVEGLSVAAISYYTVGLIKFLIVALYDSGVQFDKNIAVGLSVPFVIAGVWYATRRIHRRFLKLAIAQAEAGSKKASKD